MLWQTKYHSPNYVNKNYRNFHADCFKNRVYLLAEHHNIFSPSFINIILKQSYKILQQKHIAVNNVGKRKGKRKSKLGWNK